MRHVTRLSLIAGVCSLSLAVAADNTKQIDNLFRSYGDAVAKADEVRFKAADKAKTDTVAQLLKLAAKAYSEKDRLAETNAWKAVLRLDRAHPKAVQYFNDLGTLEQVLRDVPYNKQQASEHPLAGFVGKWVVTYNNGGTETIEFDKNGKYVSLTNTSLKHLVEPMPLDAAVNVTYPDGDHLNRYVLCGNKLFVEQWVPAAKYPKTTAGFFGRALPAE